ncbi:MAG TPA: RNA methyltransferase [Candidatus Omnitrophota bacterium]|nr:RNA methyltransferase [Candidatus Omnitrophota bacterium]
MHNKIISVKNEHIKSVVRLRDRHERDKTGLTIVEGVREIERAIESLCHFKEFYICNELLQQQDKQILKNIYSLKADMYETTKEVFGKIVYGDRQDGILGVGQPKKYSLKDIKDKKNSFLFVVEGVEKPGNLGAMLRTCDAVGIDGVIVCDEKTDIFNPNVIRSSLGTVFTNKVIVSSSAETFEYLKSRNMKICAATPHVETLYTDVNLKGPLAMAVGSEENGLSDFWMKNSTVKIKIPMKGKADSLNVSTSAAIVLYEALRQRNLFS